ncbi:MAG: hypothetical protein M3281_03635 [Chloroflexota bacterium]|nr:hypothetical protein [Chloroflexota bacterium]
MAQIALPSVVLLLPVLALGAYIGYRRAWARETITGLVLAVVLLGFSRMVGLVLAVLRLVAKLLATVTQGTKLGSLPIERAVGRLPEGLVVLGCLVAFVGGAYWLGNVLGHQGGQSRLRQLSGAVVGALNVLMVVAILSARLEDIVGKARLRRLFLVPGSPRGVGIEVPPFPSSAALLQWSAYALVLLILIAFGWGVTRLPKLRG